MSNETEWVLVQKEKLEKVADGIFSKHHSAKENKDAYDVGYFGAMLRDVEEMLAAAPQPPAEAQPDSNPNGWRDRYMRLLDAFDRYATPWMRDDGEGGFAGTLARMAEAAAEAQAQGGGEASEGWHAALDSASELVSNAPDARYRKRAEQVRDWIKAYPAAPPSAPVGVAADILRIVDTAIDVCNDRDRPAMAEDLEAVRLYVEQASAALAGQQGGDHA